MGGNFQRLGLIVMSFALSPTIAFAADNCATLVKPGLFPQTTIASATAVAADEARGTPAFCEVTGTISPVPASRIGVVYRLPANWNGKVMGLGGGGLAGNVKLEVAAAPLAKGYAVMQTDMGHPSPEALDPIWAVSAPGKLNEEQVTDFGHRATHLMTVTGKAVVQAYYGRAQSRAYWEGCSTGGRQGLMEMQRYPDDYDGVVAGAPVYNMLVYSTAVLRVQHFHAKPGSNLTPGQVSLLSRAVLKACDAQDGVEDGVLGDPRHRCSTAASRIGCRARSAPSA